MQLYHYRPGDRDGAGDTDITGTGRDGDMRVVFAAVGLHNDAIDGGRDEAISVAGLLAVKHSCDRAAITKSIDSGARRDQRLGVFVDRGDSDAGTDADKPSADAA